MDFIEHLPKSKGKDTILVVVCRFTKNGHFIPLTHPYSASTVAKLFLDQIFKLHGAPQSIVSDRDKIFTSLFWKELFKCLGTTLAFSTAYHPQSDGQTERLNQCLEGYLRCMAHLKPSTWCTLLPLAEWWYNSSFHSAIKMEPFEALYGYSPSFLPLIPVDSPTVGAVDTLLQEVQQLDKLLRENLLLAQNRMKQ